MVLAEAIKGLIWTLYCQNYSYRAIVQAIFSIHKVRISLWAVQSAVKKQLEEEEKEKSIDQSQQPSDEQIKKPGRPSSVDQEVIQRWKKAIARNHNLTAMQIFKSKTLNSVQVSYETVCRTLNRLDLRSFSAPYKFFIGGQSGMQQCLSFCKQIKRCLKKDENFFQKIIFFDESYIYSQKCGRDLVRKKYGKKLPIQYSRQKKKFHGGLSICVWRAISADGWRSIVWVDGAIDSDKYCEILSENLVVRDDMDNIVLQQDNARPHTSKQTQKFLADNQIEVLPWPSYSPDLNIIENIWSFLKNTIEKKRHLCTTKENIWRETKKAFLSEQCDVLISRLYKSLPERVEEVFKHKGGYLQ